MSLLESAIREHLALKRRTGAHEAELADAEALVGEGRQPAPPALGTGPPRPGPRPARGRWLRALARLARRHKLRTALVVVPLLLVTPLVSYSEAMLKPSDASLGVRSIEWLRDQGYRLDVASSYATAVAAVDKKPYDLVLADLQMPTMDGFELARRIRSSEAAEHRQRTPILAVTASAFEDQERKSRAVGMDGLITKPIGIEQLRATLDVWLKDARVDQPT